MLLNGSEAMLIVSEITVIMSSFTYRRVLVVRQAQHERPPLLLFLYSQAIVAKAGRFSGIM